MEGRPTDHCNLNLAKLHKDVVLGNADGKVIWQPRIQCWIADKIHDEGKLPEPYTGMSKREIYTELGCSARIYEYNNSIYRVDHPKVKRYSNKLSDTKTEYVVETPVGKISTVQEETPSTWATLTKKSLIEDEHDMKVAIWMDQRCEFKWNEEYFQNTKKEWGDLGSTTLFMPRVNIQHLFITTMGVENTIYALYDYPTTVDKYFQILGERDERYIKVINESPIDIINFGDNLHGGTLSPDLFKKYVLPAYQERCELLHKAGKFTHSHWDGDTKTLLPFAKETGLDGIEAITPVPQGDVTLEDIKEGLGEDIYLIDGIAAVLFDKTYPLKDLKEQTERLIELFAPKLILGISDEISSTGNLDRIKYVGKIVDEYNASL